MTIVKFFKNNAFKKIYSKESHTSTTQWSLVGAGLHVIFKCLEKIRNKFTFKKNLYRLDI